MNEIANEPLRQRYLNLSMFHGRASSSDQPCLHICHVQALLHGVLVTYKALISSRAMHLYSHWHENSAQ